MPSMAFSFFLRLCKKRNHKPRNYRRRDSDACGGKRPFKHTEKPLFRNGLLCAFRERIAEARQRQRCAGVCPFYKRLIKSDRAEEYTEYNEKNKHLCRRQ